MLDKFPEVSPSDFDVVSGKADSQGFVLLRTHQRCGDELAVGEKMNFAVGHFDAKTSSMRLTVSACWGGKTAFVFETEFHRLVAFRV